MSKKKGLSMEEKYDKAKEFLLQKAEPFTMKELEKYLPKAKGIVWQSVKQVVETLVADGVVQSDKIGSNVFYWCFPSTQGKSLENKLDGLKRQVADAKRKHAELETSIKKARVGKDDSEERRQQLSRHQQLKARQAELQILLAKYGESDPEFIAKMEENAQLSKDAANRWTDAIFTIKGHVKTKFMIEEERMNKEFGIPEELDYID
mmetsp:Transcript_29743/g.53414  ORF Transcript_29743/g.53414 Transcript_29743/m.53414 type:complete len:206 (-) Transcript_29743:619-1236(-)